jgi:large subunit ribosomal protein L21
MYAIFEDSGTQLMAEVGDELTLDIRQLDDDASSVTFGNVLAVGGDGNAKIGTPYLDGVTVTAEIINPDVKGEKIDVIKFKRRKGYRRKQGHRQRYMHVKVTEINA